MNKMSTSSARMPPRLGYIGIFMVFGLMAVTLYMAFAFPYTLFHLKQTETTELKSVIIVGLSGEKSPSLDSYFIGEEPPEELRTIGYEQLTNVGKERMYLLGKFLKLRYYHLLLNGDPRKIYVRSADIDRCLESAQALLAGLNPPKDQWSWSTTGELNNWQPKAVHTTASSDDNYLSSESDCARLDLDKMKWKNSIRYQQLLNEFRHDLQTLRSNTGLEFEDDLEMLSNIEDSLQTRKTFKGALPAWYTSTFANRLNYITDVATECRYSSANVQRLYVGRLLHEITENINIKIRLHQKTLAVEGEEVKDNILISLEQKRQQQQFSRFKTTLKNEPNMFVYITDKQQLSALLNSLQIYSSQPQFGSLLIIELHYDPINQLHFLRLFTVNSTNPNLFPEPLRVNPLACVDSVECVPQQFEQNIRHLMLDKISWQEACLDHSSPITTSKSSLPPRIEDSISQPMQQSTTQLSTFQLLTTNAASESTSYLDKDEENLIVGPIHVQRPEVPDQREQNRTELTEFNKSYIEVINDPSIIDNNGKIDTTIRGL